MIRTVFRLSPPPAYNPADDVLDIINQVASPVKIIINFTEPELIYSPLTTFSNLSHGE